MSTGRPRGTFFLLLVDEIMDFSLLPMWSSPGRDALRRDENVLRLPPVHIDVIGMRCQQRRDASARSPLPFKKGRTPWCPFSAG